MTWFSARWRCGKPDDETAGCGNIWDEIVRSSEKDQPLKCPECEELLGFRIPFANIFNHAYQDGSNRMVDIKERRKLEREAYKAKRRGDAVSEQKILKEREFFRGK